MKSPSLLRFLILSALLLAHSTLALPTLEDSGKAIYKLATEGPHNVDANDLYTREGLYVGGNSIWSYPGTNVDEEEYTRARNEMVRLTRNGHPGDLITNYGPTGYSPMFEGYEGNPNDLVSWRPTHPLTAEVERAELKSRGKSRKGRKEPLALEGSERETPLLLGPPASDRWSGGGMAMVPGHEMGGAGSYAHLGGGYGREHAPPAPYSYGHTDYGHGPPPSSSYPRPGMGEGRGYPPPGPYPHPGMGGPRGAPSSSYAPAGMGEGRGYPPPGAYPNPHVGSSRGPPPPGPYPSSGMGGPRGSPPRGPYTSRDPPPESSYPPRYGSNPHGPPAGPQGGNNRYDDFSD